MWLRPRFAEEEEGRVKESGGQEPMVRCLSKRARLGMESLGAQTSISQQGTINLGNGTPSFDTPVHILDAVKKAVSDGYTKYTPWPGYLDLREAVSEKLLQDNRLRFDPGSEILITTGAQEALSLIFLSFFDPGDEVILPDPYYGEFVRWSAMSGAVLVGVPTTREANYIVDPDRLAAAITPRTKMISLTTPSNPTGAVLPTDVLERIARIAIENDLLVLSDELYEKYVFDDHEHISIASLPEMRDRTIVVNAFSKTYAMTGFRVGYLAASAPFVSGMLPIKHAMSICPCAVSQRAALAALRGPHDWWVQVLEDCENRRGQWIRGLASLELEYAPPMGSYVFLVSGASLGMSGSEFARFLATEERLRVGGGSGFGLHAKDSVRVSLMVSESDLEEGLSRMKRAVQAIG